MCIDAIRHAIGARLKPNKAPTFYMKQQTKNRLAAGKQLGGRPTDYKPEYCQGIVDFFTVPTYRTICVKRTTKALRKDCQEPEVIEEFEERGGDLPFFSQYAKSIGVIHNTLCVWCEKYPEFKESYNIAKELQKTHLIQNGVQGNYNPAFAIFTAKNITDMRDQPTTVIDQSIHTHNTLKIDLTKAEQPELVSALLGRMK